MPESQAQIRTRLLLNTSGLLLLLSLLTWGAFSMANHDVIVLRNVQRGHAPSDYATLSTLAQAATSQFRPKDQYAVLDILQARGHDELAEPIMRHMVSSNAKATTLHLRWADTLSHLGRYDQAKEQYTPLLRTSSEISKETILLRMARNANHAGWLDQAIERYRQYLTLVPHDHAARAELAGILLSSGHKEEAIQEYQLVSQEQPDNVQWLLALADAALTESDSTAVPSESNLLVARKALEAARTIDGVCTTTKKLAVVLSWLDEYSQTLELLRNCDPPTLDEAEVCRAYAQALSLADQWTPAEHDTFVALGQAALEQPATSAKLLAALARAMRTMTENDLAVRLFESAVEHDPGNRMVRFECANLLHEMKRFQEADTHYTVLLNTLDAEQP